VSPSNVDGVWEEGCAPPHNFFVNFQVKNAGFYAFLLRKTTCGQNPYNTGGLIDPLGDEDVKRREVERLAGGSTSPPLLHRQLAFCTEKKTA